MSVTDVVPTTRGWDRFLSERDRQVIAASGYGARMGLGKRPALVIVDVTYNFCGRRPEAIETSVADWHNSCGEDAWRAIDRIRALKGFFQEHSLPVFYTTRQEPGDGPFFEGRWKDKNPRFIREGQAADRNQIVAEIAPGEHDIVIEKMKPSGFYGTPLTGYLVDLGVDSLVVCGVATSGCVRATVVDAVSLNYRVCVIEDGTFDRCEASHWMSLFDMDCKYADVLPLDEFVAVAPEAYRDAGGFAQLSGMRGGQQRRMMA
jgi:nicotinamidase-related amidase